MVVSLLNKLRVDSAGSKAGWTFDDANIFRTSIQVGLLESVGGITFLCRDKRRADLYAGGADFQHALYVGIVHDAARSKNRNGNVVFLLKLANIGNDICESLFQRLIGSIVQIIQLKAEVTACERALYDNGVRKTVVFPQPLGQNQPARARRGDNRHNARLTAGGQFRQGQRQACAGNNQVRALLDSLCDIFCVM